MFYNLNKYKNLQLVLALLLFGWSVYTVFTQMTPCPPEGQSILYPYIFALWGNHPILCKSLVTVLLLSAVLVLDYFFQSNKFSENRSSLPVVFFLLFLNLGHFLTQLSPMFFTMLAILLVLLVNSSQENGRPDKNKVFLSGVMIALASLIDIGALCLIPFMTFALLTDNNYHPKDLLVLLSGILLVVIYLFSFYYLADSMPMLWASFRQLTFFAFFAHIAELGVMDWVLIAFLLLSSFYVIAVVKIYYDNKLIILRKRFMVVVFLSFMMVIAILLTGLAMSHSLIYLIVPLALLDGMLAQLKTRRYLNDAFIVALFVLIWF